MKFKDYHLLSADEKQLLTALQTVSEKKMLGLGILLRLKKGSAKVFRASISELKVMMKECPNTVIDTVGADTANAIELI